MRNPMFIVLSLALLFVVVAAPQAVAKKEPAPPSEQGRSEPPPPAYESPMRDQCEAELARDHKWAKSLEDMIRAVYRDEVRPAVHAEDAALMLTNKRHVVMAYAALWILTVGFLLLMWMRQQKLVGEIARLERELSRAVEEE